LNTASTVRQQLKHMLPEEQFNGLIKSIKTELQYAKTSNKVLGGSETAENMYGLVSDSIDDTGALMAIGSGNPAVAVQGLLRSILAWAKKPNHPLNEEVRNKLGAILSSNDDAMIAQLTKEAQFQNISLNALKSLYQVSSRGASAYGAINQADQNIRNREASNLADSPIPREDQTPSGFSSEQQAIIDRARNRRDVPRLPQ